MLPTIATPCNSITTLHFSSNSVKSLLLSIIFFPNMGEAPEVFYINGFSKFGHEIETQQNHVNDQNHDSSWYEEIIDDDLKWSFKLNRFVIIASAIHYYSISMYIDSNKKLLSFSFCSALLNRYNFCFVSLL